MNRRTNILPMIFDERKTDTFLTAFFDHPYLFSLAVCLLITPFTFADETLIPKNSAMISAALFLLLGSIAIYSFSKNRGLYKPIAVITEVLYIAVVYLCFLIYSTADAKGFFILLFGWLVLAVVYAFSDTNNKKIEKNAFYIIACGFMLKLYYVLYTTVRMRQNDVHSFGNESGHAGYIEYLLFNHHLPDFDVRNVWQYCHPPLHHTISACWIGILENVFNIPPQSSRESLQMLTLFYSVCIMISAYKILRYFNVSGLALYIPLAIINFHPAFILMSGSINNDILSVAFMMGAFLCTLDWYENQTMFGIIKIAFCIGLGMMTKLSAALIAPPVAAVFIVVLVRNYKYKLKKLILEFSVFGIICIPLALWFEIKNYILYKVPITYVQEMSDTALQYIGDRSFTSRITDFSSYQLDSVFENWAYRDEAGMVQGYNEYNPLITLLKNSLFGESINDSLFTDEPVTLNVCRIFFWLSAFIALIYLIIMIFMIIKKSEVSKLDIGTKLLLGLFYGVMILNFMKMAHDYPFTCTMNFRYITPTVIVTSVFVGIFLQKLKQKKIAYAASSAVLSVLTVCFVFLSSWVYISVCYP